MQGLQFSGDLFVDRLTSAGVAQGLMKWGNAIKLEIKPNAETKDLVSKMRDTAGQVLDSVTKQKPADFSLVVNQVDKDVLAMALMGDAVARVGAGAAVTDEAAVAKLDKYISLAHRDVSLVEVTDQADSAYTVDVDYEIIGRTGMIKCLSTGSIVADEALKVDYTWAAESGYKISGATQPTIKALIMLDGKNDVNGKTCILDVFEAQLKPDNAIDFFKDDYNEISFSGTLITPSGKTAPFEIQYEE